jgi:hypothetical protein
MSGYEVMKTISVKNSPRAFDCAGSARMSPVSSRKSVKSVIWVYAIKNSLSLGLDFVLYRNRHSHFIVIKPIDAVP